MKIKGICLIFLICLSFGYSKNFDVQVSYGGWTLSPFQTIVENESEDLIRKEFNKLIETVFPRGFLTPFLSNVDISSSGSFYSLALWYRFSQSPFSLGLRGDYFIFRLPYSLSAEESIAIFGLPLASLKTQGQGKIRLNSLAISVLSRWTALSTSRLDLSLLAGMILLPFEGEISLSQTTSIGTPFGDVDYSGSFDHSIEEVRNLERSVPSLIVSPCLAVELKFRFSKDAGIILNITGSQGSFYSGGLFFSF